MPKPNYRHAKKQKEAARKARQEAKQQRRATAPGASDAHEDGALEATSGAPASGADSNPGSLSDKP